MPYSTTLFVIGKSQYIVHHFIWQIKVHYIGHSFWCKLCLKHPQWCFMDIDEQKKIDAVHRYIKGDKLFSALDCLRNRELAVNRYFCTTKLCSAVQSRIKGHRYFCTTKLYSACAIENWPLTVISAQRSCAVLCNRELKVTGISAQRSCTVLAQSRIGR